MESVQSPIIPIVAQLIAQNPGTISLGQGVVYYGPPQTAIDALSPLNDSVDNHKYGLVGGLPALCDTISNKLKLENKIIVGNGNRVIVTAGANMAFLNVLFAITDPGDEVILSLPYYFNHEMAITMLNCKPVLVSTDENYQLCTDKIRRAISKRTRVIVTVSPNNPSGVVYPESILREINEFCRKFGIYHISDEAYEYFTYDEATHFSPGSIPDTNEFTVSLFSLSKAYGFAGWRIGYMVFPEQLTAAIMKAQDTNLICPATASQYAAIGAMTTGIQYCNNKLNVIKNVRKMMLAELETISSFCTVPQSDGAFYLFLNIDTDIDDMIIVKRLIQEHKVAVIPGHTFGMAHGCYLRVAYGALDENVAREGIQRLTNGLKSIIQ